MKTSVIEILHSALAGRRVRAKGMTRPGTVKHVEVSAEVGRVYLTFEEPSTELSGAADVRPSDVLVLTCAEEFEFVE